MQHDVKIDHDLEKSPLQIKTDSALGSDHVTVVTFYTAEEDVAGVFSIRFKSPPTYRFLYCMNEHTNFPTALPSDAIKVWTFTRTAAADSFRVVIHCNDKEVFNMKISDTLCDNAGWDWRIYWTSDVEKILFSKAYDTAADFYRPGL